MTSHGILNLVSDSSSTTARDLVYIKNDNTAATKAECLVVENDAVMDFATASRVVKIVNNATTTNAATMEIRHTADDATGCNLLLSNYLICLDSRGRV